MLPHVEEPLEADERLHHLAAPLALPHGVVVVLNAFQRTQAVQFGGNCGAGGEPLHAGVLRPRIVGHAAVGADDINDGQAVAFANFEVHQVVARRNLQSPGAELHLDGLVANHWNLTANDGQHGHLANLVPIPAIVRVHGDAGIAQHGFGPRGSDGYVVIRVFSQGIADVIELAIPFLVVHFQVGQSGSAARTPVDNAFVPVDEPLVEEVDEGGANGAGRTGVKGEPQPGPVAGGSQTAVLLVDGIAVAPHPFPDALLELFPSQVVAVASLLGQGALNHPLGGDAGVVFAGKPERRVAAHAMPAGQCVLEAGSESVPQVQFARYVGRRHNYAERLTGGIGAGDEVSGLPPVLVDTLFDGSSVVGSGHRGGGVSHQSIQGVTTGRAAPARPRWFER